jgi:uncharacterized protein (TIGR03437 family)
MRACLLLSLALPLLAAAQALSFLPPTEVANGSSAVVYGCSACVAVADFNNDGKPDIAFNIQSLAPQGGVLLGNGDGTFRPLLGFNTAVSGSFLVGDFNGDGKPDLIFTANATIFPGKGDGTFGTPVAVPGCGVVTLAADFNKDGKTDLICGTALLLSNGDNSFRAAPTPGTIADETAILAADFNNDGIPDLMLHEVSGILAIVLGHGDGTFGPEIVMNYGVKPNSYFSPFLAGDFNGDGKIDLVTVSARGEFIDLLPGKGDGTFGSPIETPVNPFYPPINMTATGDFNKDGYLDFISDNAIYAGNGDGTFRFPVFFGPTAYACGAARAVPIPFPCDYNQLSTAVGDFNNDGLPDLASNVLLEPGPTGNFHEVGEIDVLLNDSPGNGFTALGVSSAAWASPVAPGSIVSAFGTNLAPTTASVPLGPSLSFPPAPTTLGGIRLHVRDRSHTADFLAPLIYVSPTQINYILNSTDPYAWVDIERVGSPYVPQGMVVPIQPIAPGFYAAAYTTNAPGYLSLYGTGFAQADAALSSCTIGSQNVPITYAGPEIQIAGLDQVNLLLPASLSGAGVQPLSCIFETAQQVYGITNTVNVTFR